LAIDAMGRSLARTPWRALMLCLLLALPHAHAADTKVVRFAFEIGETGFDPAQESDFYSAYILEAVFDSLLTYDYLARPVKVVPNTIEAMPEIGDNGATYTFRIRKGIYFAPDPAFKGSKRELTAADYAYSMRRMFDPVLRSPVLFQLENKIIGLDELAAEAKKSGKFDYDRPVPGLQVVDRYTLRVRLKAPDYNFLYALATPSVVAMAREVVEFYGDDVRAHPVGTGAFMLKEWKRSSKIVLERNPNYRDHLFSAAPEDTPEDRAIVAALKDKKLPLVDRVEVYIVDEQQPRWLAFLNEEHDYLENLPNEFINTAAPGGKLAPNLARRGIRMQREPDLEITVTAFYNMEDPVIGGYSAEKIALRRAMTLGYNAPEELFIARRGQAIRAESLIPPGVAGYDPSFRSDWNDYSPPKAKALLDMFGYIDRDGDGYRETPDGKSLKLIFSTAPDARSKVLSEVWKKSMDAIGINIDFDVQKWPDLVKKAKLNKLQVGSYLSWQADYPDAENFFQLLYGPNSGSSNDAFFRQKEFDSLYEQSRRLPDSSERTRLYYEMNRLILVYAPWKLGVHRIRTHLAQPWLLNYKKHPILHQGWKYLDIDLGRLGKSGK
jgi:oligopeptide transport system substrate-binding protein